MAVRIILSIFFLITIRFIGFGQSDNLVRLYGRIVSEEGMGLSNAHIVNNTNETGTISNHDGYFSIHCNNNDTILITSIGFRKIKYIVPKIHKPKFLKNFILHTDTVDLVETIIYPYPATASALKKDILVLSLEPEPKIDLHLEAAEIQPLPSEGFVIKGPITKLYEAFSRHAKIQRKYFAIVKADHKIAEVAKIYNKDLVKKLTGLKNEKEIIRFMEFCDLDPEFILLSNIYELYYTINNCYKEFVSIDN